MKKQDSNSPLTSSTSRILLGVFVVIALVQVGILGLLAEDALRAGKSAHREQKLVAVAKGIARQVKLGSSSMGAFYSPGNKKRRSNEKIEKFDQAFASLQMSMKDAGLDVESLRTVKETGESIKVLMARPSSYNDFTSADTQELLEGGFRFFKAINGTIAYLHSVMNSEKSIRPAFGIEPEMLVVCFALVSPILIILSALLINYLLVRPVVRLTAKVERLKSLELIEKPENTKSDLDELESSFHHLSVDLKENEKFRKAYLDLLQDLQRESLRNVKERLNQCLEMGELSEKGSFRLERAKVAVDQLQPLIVSMSNSLSTSTLVAKPQISEYSINRLLEDVVLTLESISQKRGIQLILSCNDEIIWKIDPQQITRVIQNLISNAIKYSPDKGTVLVKGSIENDRLLVTVEDEGPGIGEEDQKKLFKKFSQLVAEDGVKREGIGLGLTIVRQIVDEHSGEIGCNSTPGKGSCFWFQLPRQETPIVGAEEDIQNHDQENQKWWWGLNAKLIGLLASFVILQAVLVANLHGRLLDSISAAKLYSNSKEMFLYTQELESQDFVWVNRACMVISDNDVSHWKVADPAVQDQLRIGRRLFEMTKGDRELGEIFSHVLKTQKTLARVSKFIMDRLERMTPATMTSIHSKVFSKDFNRSEDLAKASQIAEERLRRSSMDFTQFQNGIFSSICFSMLLCVVYLLAVYLVCSKVVSGITILCKKAEKFAQGENIAPTLKGNDELAQLDKRLCDAALTLKQSEQMRQSLLDSINHDLRSPLSSVLMNVELVHQGAYGEVSEQMAQAFGKIEALLQALITHIKDLLLIEKIDAGGYQLKRLQLNLAACFHEQVTSLSEIALSKSVNVVLDKEIVGGNVVLNSDPDLFNRLIYCLLDNAIKAAPQGSSVEVDLSTKSEHLELRIRDQGEGINPALLPSIFDRFRFVDNKPVSGVGLPLCHRICKLHEFSLEVSYSAPMGTEFVLTV